MGRRYPDSKNHPFNKVRFAAAYLMELLMPLKPEGNSPLDDKLDVREMFCTATISDVACRNGDRSVLALLRESKPQSFHWSASSSVHRSPCPKKDCPSPDLDIFFKAKLSRGSELAARTNGACRAVRTHDPTPSTEGFGLSSEDGNATQQDPSTPGVSARGNWEGLL
ncbi:uncharacterized protein CLUP02_04337 [Colletotrichum lupini]|uniref:Uncharacterized protein n=1 Tax=Colletotrichum lupini TaxID=145971 RepID=A0A9Q8SKL4_9PEZI|nr:uncharacterized protein CLUP02_04337 [Colletotrichum lupini]UQC78858.1 hypothetical protein CLUP02_04337 [Colletotrichum lupini]